MLLRNLLHKLLPKKTQFAGVDVGAGEIKLAEIKIIGGVPAITALGHYPAPSGVWTDALNEEDLVLALGEAVRQVNPDLKEVCACIGGGKVISRHIKLPVIPAKELEAAVKYEAEKILPIPVDELIIRHIKLNEIEDGNGRQLHVLFAAAPAELIFQCHEIFSRAGLAVTALDWQPFALWRTFRREQKETCAIVDIGAATTHLIVSSDGLIQFTRTLPFGGDVLTRAIADAYDIGYDDARKLKEEAAELLIGIDETSKFEPDRMKMGYVLRDGLLKFVKEIRRSLEFYNIQEQASSSVKKLILSGGASKLKGLMPFLEGALDLPVKSGIPDIGMPDGKPFDPVYSVAIGLALREVMENVQNV